MTYEYRTKGTCASKITFSLEDGVTHEVKLTSGCSGKPAGGAALVEGMDAREAVQRMKGIRCGMKPTSCPDQLAKALETALEQ